MSLLAMLATGLSHIFTCIGIATVVVLFGYACYIYFRQPHPENQLNGFAANGQARLQRAASVQTYTVQSTQRLQELANNILANTQQEQAHLSSLRSEFGLNLVNIQSIEDGLGQANHSLQDTVIRSFENLLAKIQVKCVAMFTQISDLEAVLKSTNQTIVKQEQELSHIVNNFKEIESSAQIGMSRLNTGLANIQNIMESKNAYIQRLEKLNEALTVRVNIFVEESKRQRAPIIEMEGDRDLSPPDRETQYIV